MVKLSRYLECQYFVAGKYIVKWLLNQVTWCVKLLMPVSISPSSYMVTFLGVSIFDAGKFIVKWLLDHVLGVSNLLWQDVLPNGKMVTLFWIVNILLPVNILWNDYLIRLLSVSIDDAGKYLIEWFTWRRLLAF